MLPWQGKLVPEQYRQHLVATKFKGDVDYAVTLANEVCRPRPHLALSPSPSLHIFISPSLSSSARRARPPPPSSAHPPSPAPSFCHPLPSLTHTPLPNPHPRVLRGRASQVQQLVLQSRLRPSLRTQYMRTAFQRTGDATVRCSLDTELCMALEPTRADEWKRAEPLTSLDQVSDCRRSR